eukprot:PhM_4_TR4570/c0_g2_i1/m.16261
MANKTDTIVIWEGEWPLLKSTVRTVRSTVCHSWQQHVAPHLPDVSGVDSAPALVDHFVRDGFAHTSMLLQRKPWLVPTVGFGALGTGVFFASLKSGLRLATRRAVVVTGGSVFLIYPFEAKALAERAMGVSDQFHHPPHEHL